MIIDIIMGNYSQSSVESRWAIDQVRRVLKEDWKSNFHHKGLYFDLIDGQWHIWVGGSWHPYHGTLPTLDDMHITKLVFDEYVKEKPQK